MKITGCLGIALLLGLSWSPADAAWRKERTSAELDQANSRLKGQVIDYTHNHGKDNRIWSRNLYQRRDMYVYIPPGFSENERYPVMIWLHGFAQDEQSFLTMVAPYIDDAICAGKLPPMIVAAPDGSIDGEPSLHQPGSFYLNSKKGDFEDFILQDVWDFVVKHYPIRPEKGAHILAGVSMGGFGAFNLAFKHREAFGVCLGIHPPLNLRWVDCKGKYMSDFDPKCWGWRTSLDKRHEIVARFLGGVVKIKLRQLIDPLFGSTQEALVEVSLENPIEMIDRLGIRPGDLEMYVAYGGEDEFNIDAQVESFLYYAKHRGLCVGVGYEPKGRHDFATARKLIPGIIDWLGPKVAPYAPAHVEMITEAP